jgi:hypothetical protein
MPKLKSGDHRVHYGEPADREAEQLSEQQAIAPGTSGDPNDSMDDFPLVQNAGDSAKAANGQSQRAKSGQRAVDNETETAVEGVSVEDFYAYMPMHSYIYTPTREMWQRQASTRACRRQRRTLRRACGSISTARSSR